MFKYLNKGDVLQDYQSLLPQYNPDPVFIFQKDGACYFKNEPASKIFTNLENFHTLNANINIKKFIDNAMQKSISYKLEHKYYRFKLVGVKEEELIMAYSQDITELVNSMKKEQEAMRVKDDFFRNISHEMKTPLNAITALFPIIKKSVQDNIKLLNLYDVIEENSLKLQKHIEKILDIQKIQNNSLILEKDTFECTPLLAKLLKQYEEMAQEKNQDFRLFLDKENIPKQIVGDTKKIIHVIESLLSNAIKFTPDRGIIATKISYDTKEKALKITIKDSGIGISSENQKKIFEAQQVDSSTTREFEGSGLDLFIASNYLKSIHGSIYLESTLGKGSLFSATIPC